MPAHPTLSAMACALGIASLCSMLMMLARSYFEHAHERPQLKIARWQISPRLGPAKARPTVADAGFLHSLCQMAGATSWDVPSALSCACCTCQGLWPLATLSHFSQRASLKRTSRPMCTTSWYRTTRPSATTSCRPPLLSSILGRRLR